MRKLIAALMLFAVLVTACSYSQPGSPGSGGGSSAAPYPTY